MRRARRLVLGLAFTLAAAGVAPGTLHAHDEPYSFVDIHVTGDSLSGRIVAHVEDLAGAIGASGPFALAATDSVESRLDQLRHALAERFALEVGGRRPALQWDAWSWVPERQSIAFTWRASAAPTARRILRGPLFADDPAHETYVNVYEGGTVTLQDLLTRRHRVAALDGGPTGVREVAGTFVAQGLHHIFIGPDHILFVIALLLPGGGVRRLLQVVTSFTVAHSITLALAALGWVVLPARVVEPVIALSIIVVAFEVMRSRGRGRDHRVAVAFGFGLVHGFGFASVLAEFGLPTHALGVALASFNVGVELGQAAIVLAVAPLAAAWRARAPSAAPRVEAWAAAGIAAAGAWWLVERLIGTA